MCLLKDWKCVGHIWNPKVDWIWPCQGMARVPVADSGTSGYMGRAGPVGRSPEIPARLANTPKIGHAITWKPGQPGSRLRATGIRADSFPCNSTQRASPSWQACNTRAHMTFNHDDERQEVQIDDGNGRKSVDWPKKTINWGWFDADKPIQYEAVRHVVKKMTGS